MRLIDTKTGKFAEFTDSSTAPLYAILSHTWDKEHGEQSYQDVVRIQEKYGLAAHQSSNPPAPGIPSESHAAIVNSTNDQSSAPTSADGALNQGPVEPQTAIPSNDPSGRYSS